MTTTSPSMGTSNQSQISVWEHRDALKRLQRKTAVIGFAAGVVTMVAWGLFSSWYGSAVHISDDFNLGRSLSGEADCEVLAEAIYGHDILVLESDRPFGGWAPRAEQNFYRGCMGDAQITDNGGGAGGD